MQKNKAGIYCWAGPGTIRMVKQKFPHLNVNNESLMSSYNSENLQAAKDNLGLTDAWVTYSWGFSEKTEQEDYQFIRSKLDNFKQLKIKTHGYIQGPNLVRSEHQNKDYWCRDHRGRQIPYHRGRSMTCINNPNTRDYIKHKFELALNEEFDGIFIDNLYFGLLPLVVGDKKISFFGCRCRYCLEAFKSEEGGTIPTSFSFGTKIFKAYRDFRSRSLMTFSKDLSEMVHKAGKLYGSNSLDPKMDTKLYYGTDLKILDKQQDYILFENHDLPRKDKSNSHLAKLIKSLTSPVFIVSYKQGIGREKMYEQEDFDSIYTESKKLGYFPCYKASEYSFDGGEENFDFRTIDRVNLRSGLDLAQVEYASHKPLGKGWMLPLLNYGYVPFMKNYYDNELMRKLFNWVYYLAIA